MKKVINVKCQACNHTASLNALLLGSLGRRKLKCRVCGGAGKVTEEIPLNEVLTKGPSVYSPEDNKIDKKHTKVEQPLCSTCNRPINKKRLEALVYTDKCTECASKAPNNEQKRFIRETWGTRDDWKRDRASWKR